MGSLLIGSLLLEVNDQLPEPLVDVVPNELPPANSSTVLLASAVPVKVGVVSLVKLSLFDVPESELASRSGVDGALGGTLSTLKALTGRI